ncbi:uncharacterized protein LOC142340933 [Convolutriloba macropyga]|uniref:uncharacterized protein LOC142340933 n=1 Tax=Convolutriloba macropyga TaxID=536237 RepID=UPI003F521AA2
MKWTVESESQKLEQWFLDVEICVRYFPNDVSQVALLFACGNVKLGKNKEVILCNRVNTPVESQLVYNDVTDNGMGGCFMSWMLKAPYESPAWMLNSRKCFLFRSN